MFGPLGRGLYEVRSHLATGIARVIFTIKNQEMVLLHGFIKKTQKTPLEALALAEKRKRDYEQG
jgi:phage-related protein